MMSEAEQAILTMLDQRFFKIDSKGRIWRLRRTTGVRGGGTTVYDYDSPRRAESSNNSYLQIVVKISGKRYRAMAHRIVWIVANGPIPDGEEINHKNGAKHDNRIANLEVVTRSENMKHAHHIGLWAPPGTSGERHGMAKLSDEEVRALREKHYLEGLSYRHLGLIFGISAGHARKIATGMLRTAAGGPIVSMDY